MRILLAVIALTFTLVGCGDDDEPIRSGGSEEPTLSEPDLSETLRVRPMVCDLATEADVEAAFGEDVPPGSISSGSTTDENDLSWMSDNCNWDVEDGLEVSLALTFADDFADGELLCPELDSFDVPSTPVEGLDATSAAWVNDKIDPHEGTLRICTERELMDIDIESPDGSRDPATMQAQAMALAEVVLTNLG